MHVVCSQWVEIKRGKTDIKKKKKIKTRSSKKNK